MYKLRHRLTDAFLFYWYQFLALNKNKSGVIKLAFEIVAGFLTSDITDCIP